MKAPLPPDELQRLADLERYAVLDTSAEESFDDLCELAARICQAPIALISLIDEKRQWFKSKIGLSITETSRELAFCAHAINQPGLFIVPDATQDPRFADNPQVTGEPHIRFYAGAPLITPAGHALGTLCVIDREPREMSSDHQRALRVLSRHVMTQLELRRRSMEAAQLRAESDETRNELRHERALLDAAEKSRQELLVALDENQRVNQALRDSDARLQVAIKASRIGLWEWDVASNRVFASPEWKQLIGCDDDEVPTNLDEWELLLHPEDKDRVRLQLAARLEGRSPNEYQNEFRLRHKDGSYRWIYTRAELFHDDAGKPVRILGCHIDITERKLIEEKLRESEAQYRGLIEQALDGIFVSDAEGNLLLANSRWCELLGYDKDQAAGINAKQTYLEEEREVHAKRLEHVRAGQTLRFERIVKRRDGSTFPAEISLKMLDNGCVQGIFHDVTERKQAEEQLLDGERKLRKVLDGLGPSLFVGLMTPEGILLEANQPALAAANLEPEDVLAKPVDQTYWWSYSERVQEQLRSAIRQAAAGTPCRYDAQVRVAPETLIWIDFALNPLRDEAGRVEYLVPSASVITERKLAEEALRISEQRFRLAASSGQVWEWDIVANVVSFPPEFWRRLGYEGPETANTVARFESILHPEDSERWRQAVKDHISRRLPYDLEYRARAKSGEYLWFHTRGQAVWDESGQAIFMAGTAFDVTDRKRAEAALIESKEQYRRIVELSPDAVTIHQEGRWVFTNSATARILGVEEPSQLVGRSLLDFMDPNVHDQVKARWKVLYEDKQPAQTAELKMVRPDGTIVYLETRAVPVTWQGQPAAQVVARDVTERKHANETLRSYAERLQGLSRRLMEVEEAERCNINRELHDRIGQNLSALSLSIDLIRSRLAKGSLRAVGTRLNAAQKLLEATTAQVRNVMAELHPPALDDYGLLAALRTYAEFFSAGAGIRIAVNGEDLVRRLSPIVEMAMFRVAQEALANAAKHARAQRIDVTLASTPDKVTLTISDDGTGFDTRRADTAGVSWGLTIMRERAEAIGAALRIESSPGSGARVVVEAVRGPA